MENHSPGVSPGRRRFRIVIAGRLDEGFVDGIPGVELRQSADGSMLEGWLIDQSQLRGVLDRLWQLGIDVLNFETYVPDPHETES